jgi:UDP-3-O-[3-hydroxymyristoyl] N-acetylglucosamine deacetylase
MQATSNTLTFTGRGLTSRQDVTVEIRKAEPGAGIIFELKRDKNIVAVPARSEYVVNTLRNVVLGRDGIRLCIVEHFLCAASLWGLNDLIVCVDGMEMPLGDGSAGFWLDLFEGAGWQRQPVEASIELKEKIVLTKGDRLLMAVPDQSFSASYMMDWDHPKIGKRWQTWDAERNPREIADARTFGWLKDHQLLGLDKDVVSLTADGFTHPLRYEDEPVRHKLLDLIGDLTLSGVNPLAIKARFVSIKAGHELDVELAKELAAQSL